MRIANILRRSSKNIRQSGEEGRIQAAACNEVDVFTKSTTLRLQGLIVRCGLRYYTDRVLRIVVLRGRDYKMADITKRGAGR